MMTPNAHSGRERLARFLWELRLRRLALRALVRLLPGTYRDILGAERSRETVITLLVDGVAPETLARDACGREGVEVGLPRYVELLGCARELVPEAERRRARAAV